MNFRTAFILIFSSLLTIPGIIANSNKAAMCNVCLAIIKEVNNEITKANPKEKLSVGSFRIDSNGNQKLKEVSFARSDVHLTDVFENICEKLSDYKPSSNPDEYKLLYVRTKTFDGLNIPSSLYKDDNMYLKKVCSDFLEEFDEDDMIKQFKDPKSDVMEEFCVREAKTCDSNFVVKFQMANTLAVQEAIKLNEENLKKEAEEKLKREEEEKQKKEEDRLKQEEENEKESENNNKDDSNDDIATKQNEEAQVEKPNEEL